MQSRVALSIMDCVQCRLHVLTGQQLFRPVATK